MAKKILLGVTGSIAAYKAIEILRKLKDRGFDLQVVLTKSATQFVTPFSFQVLSHHPVGVDLFHEEQAGTIDHIELAQRSDLLLIAPASANFIAKLAHGIADDLLSTVCLASKTPILIAPAMNNFMWEHPALQANLETIMRRGVQVIGPEAGYLACETIGKGRLAAIEKLVEEVVTTVSKQQVLSGKKVLVTAGPTIQPIDSFRFITNYSSGKMGYALAKAAVLFGAETTLLSGPSSLQPPAGLSAYYPVKTTQEMADAFLHLAGAHDLIFQAAAISDYKTALHPQKIKQESFSLEFHKDLDILKTYGERKKSGQVLVGFAAEDQQLLENAVAKLKSKHCDLIVANLIGGHHYGFQSDENKVTLVFPDRTLDLPAASKEKLAEQILHEAFQLSLQKTQAADT